VPVIHGPQPDRRAAQDASHKSRSSVARPNLLPLIFFGSPKGGVGKTTVAANVAAGLAQLGFAVTVIDLDPQNALRLHFGVPLQDAAGFAWSLVNPYASAPWHSFLRQSQWGINILPFGEMDTVAALAVADALGKHPERLTQIFQAMLNDPRQMLLVDSPPGPSSALSAALPYVDLLVCVLLADAISASLLPSIEAGRAFGPGTQAGADGGRIRYVLNQFEPGSRLSRATAEAIRPYLGNRLLGEIRRDECVAEAAASQCPVPFFAPSCIAAADIAGISRNIAGAFGFAAQWSPMR
jgi:cellulose synthase operon protein YhjQ